ncbi:serine/threonine-protein kinase [Acidianus sp. HS-5]|uniref:serine/threonine-protein kinase n=1 Tax=Acidianus sp. HS-5 TaxID=2886040 RepID=UPI001F01AF15|nr:serine/threonine-protein kinase [Acidianus sp. HS-5]BDC17339.1 hypothetical protein HS5_02290 [Acidianus sp. HS-5]
MISVKSIIAEGKRYFCLKEYYNAYYTFNSAINLFPGSEESSTPEGKYVYADALRWKAITEIKLGMLDDAIYTFNSLLQKLGKNTPEVIYYLSLARYYYSFFLIDKRELTLRSALGDLRAILPSVQVDKDKFLALMALIYAELDDLGNASNLLTGNSVVLNIARAHVYRKKWWLTKAELEIDQILQYEPDNVDALLEKSLILRQDRKYAEALAVLDNILNNVEPTNILAVLFKAEVLETVGRIKEAFSLYTRIDRTLYSPLVKSKLSKLAPSSQTSPTVPQSSPQVFPQTHSKLLVPARLKAWDPKVWIGKRFSIYEVKEVLGEGGNGYVIRAETPSGIEVAIKVLKIYSGVPEEYFDNLMNEASNLSSLSKRPNVVEIYAVNVDKLVLSEIMSGNLSFYERDPPRIVMEFMKGGTLGDLLQDDVFFYSSKWEHTVYRAISTVAEALDYMHISGFVHMDVKPQNIFLSKKPNDPDDLQRVNFKLGDLGSAMRIGSKITQLTVEYAPPEVYLDTAKPYIDTFSLGITMYVLLTRKIDRPDLQEMNDAFSCFQKGDMNCVKEKVKVAQAKLKLWDPNVPSEVKQLMSAMINSNPLKRPASIEVSKYLKKVMHSS